ncbi:hypothetical protein NFA_15190 [Nocardia farcinica IFM 10152]|uniref:Uncharacterized protein n=1 Tax=Nocardia farcinica (strain IFM 10152) TaxID=247156 RepID=Q5YZM7_NOCFA|nr:hypothetical protein NFA_15190 [Nocardia farcinica IFM 10152]
MTLWQAIKLSDWSHPASQPPTTIVPTHLWDALEAHRPAWFTRLRDKGRVVVVRNTPPA